MSRASSGFIWGLSSMKRGVARVLDRAEPVIELIIRVCGWSAIIFVVAIFLFVLKEGLPQIFKLDWKEFLTSPNWRPTSQVREQFGILALMTGTLSVTLLAMMIALPFGLGAAVYISEFSSPKVKETLKVIIELLAAIPSVVWGFIGYMVIGPVITHTTCAPVGVNVLNGGGVLWLHGVRVVDVVGWEWSLAVVGA